MFVYARLTIQQNLFHKGTKKSSGSSSSSAMPSISSGTSSHNRPVSVTTTNSSSYSSSQPKHSASSHSYSPQASKHTATPPKPRLDPYSASVSQSIYNSISQDQQLKAFKQQLQQHQQSNHHASQQQQELWQQMNASGYLSGMSGMSNTEVYKLMSQIGKPMDSYTSSSQPGSGQHHGKY